MKYAKPLIASAIVLTLMLAASAWAWPRLGSQLVAVHFGLDGRPNGFAPKGQAVFVLPGVAFLIALIFAIMPPLMPARARLERSWGPFVTVWMAILILLLFIHAALMAYAVGIPVNIARVTAIGVGSLLAVIGNLLGKVRYNYVFGVRTPWTLSNERVWDRTHRFAGRLMAVAGVIMALAGLVSPWPINDALPFLVLAGALGPSLAAIVYSYFESRREDRRLAGHLDQIT